MSVVPSAVSPSARRRLLRGGLVLGVLALVAQGVVVGLAPGPGAAWRVWAQQGAAPWATVSWPSSARLVSAVGPWVARALHGPGPGFALGAVVCVALVAWQFQRIAPGFALPAVALALSEPLARGDLGDALAAVAAVSWLRALTASEEERLAPVLASLAAAVVAARAESTALAPVAPVAFVSGLALLRAGGRRGRLLGGAHVVLALYVLRTSLAQFGARALDDGFTVEHGLAALSMFGAGGPALGGAVLLAVAALMWRGRAVFDADEDTGALGASLALAVAAMLPLTDGRGAPVAVHAFPAAALVLWILLSRVVPMPAATGLGVVLAVAGLVGDARAAMGTRGLRAAMRNLSAAGVRGPVLVVASAGGGAASQSAGFPDPVAARAAQITLAAGLRVPGLDGSDGLGPRVRVSEAGWAALPAGLTPARVRTLLDGPVARSRAASRVRLLDVLAFGASRFGALLLDTGVEADALWLESRGFRSAGPVADGLKVLRWDACGTRIRIPRTFPLTFTVELHYGWQPMGDTGRPVPAADLHVEGADVTATLRDAPCGEVWVQGFVRDPVSHRRTPIFCRPSLEDARWLITVQRDGAEHVCTREI